MLCGRVPLCTDCIQSYCGLKGDPKMTYEKPELELIEIDARDIVTSSPINCTGDGGAFDGFPPLAC